MGIIRKTGGRDELDALATHISHVTGDVANVALSVAGFAAGTTDGHVKTTAAATYRIGGFLYQKQATDDLWDLSGEEPTEASGADSYAGIALCLDAQGQASYVRANAEDPGGLMAVFDTLVIPGNVAVIGLATAGPATDFTASLALNYIYGAPFRATAIVQTAV